MVDGPADTVSGSAASAQGVDAARERRDERARAYFEKDLNRQREWYSRKASSYKSYAQWCGIAVIAAGALITFFAAVGPDDSLWTKAIIAGLGLAVAVLQGVLRIWRYEETWLECRKASERMKREQRLYVNVAGAYAEIADEEARFRHFVEAVERIIAEEQQLFFDQGRAETTPPTSRQAAAAPTGTAAQAGS